MTDFYYIDRQIRSLRTLLQYSENEIQTNKQRRDELASLYNELFNNYELLPLTKIFPLDIPKTHDYLYKIESNALYLASKNHISLTILQNIMISIFTMNVDNILISQLFDKFVEFIIELPNDKEKFFRILFEIIFLDILNPNLNKYLTLLIQESLENNQTLIKVFDDGIILYLRSYTGELDKQVLILRFLIRLQNNTHSIEVIHDDIIWFSIGQALAASTWINHRQVFEEIRNWGIEFLPTSVPTMIRNILHCRSEILAQDIHSCATILRNFSGAIIDELGPDMTLPGLLEWYRSEENKTFRLAFHQSYILIMREGYVGEVLLTVTAPFVRYEQDIDILLKIFEDLNNFIHWHQLSHIVQLILEHPQIEIIEYNLIHSKLIQPYFDELHEDIQFLNQTQDIFIKFWESRIINVDSRQKFLKYLKEWVKKTNTPSKTIKGVFIQALIRRTVDERYLSEFTQLLESLGRLKVQILDDHRDRTDITILKDETSSNITHRHNYLSLNPDNEFCFVCRRRFFQEQQIHECTKCLARFCNECLSYLNSTDPQSEHEILCLGSTIYGISHLFVQI